jgi:hypothetical protein
MPWINPGIDDKVKPLPNKAKSLWLRKILEKTPA